MDSSVVREKNNFVCW